MATKEEILSGIDEVRQRLERLLPAIRAGLEKPLPEGTWNVHDAVCHMAADANAVPRWHARIEAAAQGRSTRPPGFDPDAYNQQNVDARKGKPLDEVVEEIRAGLRSDAKAIEGLDEATLQQEIPNFRGEPVPASQMLAFSTGRHNQMHLDDIERALA